MWTKETITEQLRNGILDIQFIKRDGTLREMRCTLNEKYLPPLTKKIESTKTENPNVLAVWDIDNDGWRSFIVDQIIFVSDAND